MLDELEDKIDLKNKYNLDIINNMMDGSIILSIHEGLGNRLFQLARNISYSIKYSKKILLTKLLIKLFL